MAVQPPFGPQGGLPRQPAMLVQRPGIPAQRPAMPTLRPGGGQHFPNPPRHQQGFPPRPNAVPSGAVLPPSLTQMQRPPGNLSSHGGPSMPVGGGVVPSTQSITNLPLQQPMVPRDTSSVNGAVPGANPGQMGQPVSMKMNASPLTNQLPGQHIQQLPGPKEGQLPGQRPPLRHPTMPNQQPIPAAALPPRLGHAPGNIQSRFGQPNGNSLPPNPLLPGSNAGPLPRMPPMSGPNNAASFSAMPQNSVGGYPSAQTPVGPGMPGSMTGVPSVPPGSAAAGRRTLDPDQMPSPINVIEEDQRANAGYFETREKGLTPPLVTTNFITRDYGNASPRFMRSTMYNVPATPELMKQAGVPFGLVISPFAPVKEGEIEPPVSDFGSSGPVRCVRCKAYMCPFMQFVDGGRRFQCAFCKATTEVPQEYFQHLDHNGQRLDHYQRPELCLGAYECLATKDYCRDSVEPKIPGIIFAIDVSYPMMKEGVVDLVCRNMKSILNHLPKDLNQEQEKMKVGFMTYDSKIHFYNLSKGLSQPQQLNVGDVDDMFVPLVDGFLVSPDESEQVIDALMEQIPLMFGATRATETILGPVIQAGKEAFKAANCAGKLIVLHHNLPVAEAPGKLKNRDDRKVLGTDKEKTVLMPQNKFYNELGQECVGAGCSVDLFLFNNAYIDVATLSQVCRLSGGQVYKYTYFQPEIDGERFIEDLKRNLGRPVVFDAIMRVRTSTGVRPVDFFGSFFMANTTDTELASINADSAIACEIKHDDKLTEEDGVYIQAAILFTSCSGQRRLRVLNLSLNTGSSLAEMYRNCELDTIVNFTAKQCISRLMDSNPKNVKDDLISNCAQVLACYRKNCASPSSAGQLILPECMKLLPLYTNCLIKSDAISGGADVGCDDRAFLMSSVSSMDVSSTVAFFYPRLFSLYDANINEAGLPPQIRCTIEKIRDDGIYVLENGLYIFLYIGLSTDPNLVQDLFGVQSAAAIDIDRTRLEERENPFSKRVREIVDLLRQERPRYMRLVLVRQRDKLDVLFRHYLCEDRTGSDNNFSYVDFLCHMHKEIRALLG